jgi:hypothetical protein
MSKPEPYTDDWLREAEDGHHGRVLQLTAERLRQLRTPEKRALAVREAKAIQELVGGRLSSHVGRAVDSVRRDRTPALDRIRHMSVRARQDGYHPNPDARPVRGPALGNMAVVRQIRTASDQAAAGLLQQRAARRDRYARRAREELDRLLRPHVERVVTYNITCRGQTVEAEIRLICPATAVEVAVTLRAAGWAATVSAATVTAERPSNAGVQQDP